MHTKVNIKKLVKENWGFCLFLLLMFASRSSIADWYVVPTGSMQPTIVEGDRIFVDKMAYRLEVPFTNFTIKELDTPKRGDIVIITSEKADTRLVKRLVALPGDKVAMRNNRLFLNGKALNYLDEKDSHQFTEELAGVNHKIQLLPVANAPDSFREVTVPQGHYLVLGDNRNHSSDSRFYGFVPEHEIQGKALNVIVSLDPENYYLPRKARSFSPLI